MICKRFAKANNRYCDDYDRRRGPSFLLYIDANNLSGWAMSQPMPVGNFSWIDEKELDTFDVHSIDDYNENGYILKVDRDYPDHLQDLYNDYPLAVESLTITPEMRSPFHSSFHGLPRVANSI